MARGKYMDARHARQDRLLRSGMVVRTDELDIGYAALHFNPGVFSNRAM